MTASTSDSTKWIVPTGMIIILVAALGFGVYPKLQDWQAQKAVNHAVSKVAEITPDLSDFIKRTGFYPNSNLDAGLPEASNFEDHTLNAIAIGSAGMIVTTFQDDIPRVGGKMMYFVPEMTTDGNLRWRCETGSQEASIGDQWLPSHCQYKTQRQRTSAAEHLAKTQQALKDMTRSLPDVMPETEDQQTITIRDVTEQAVTQMKSIRASAATFFMNNGHWPSNNQAMGLEAENKLGGTYFRYMRWNADGSVEARFNDYMPGIEGHRLWLRANSDGKWECGASLSQEYLPDSCNSERQ